ncbi:hypothetical protein [Streptomyces sp. AC154]|uniref:hypothetical protein n=1 Tax=Streptomyces sp. AC154 TaxID=3143184 RepID=UPI003F810288
MTYDTERTPRIPTESPTAAEQPAVPAEESQITSEQPAVPAEQSQISSEQPAVPAEQSQISSEQSPAGADRATEHSPRSTEQPTAASFPAGEPASAADRPLFREADQERLALRLQQAVTEFVENPVRAVEEAEGAFDAAVEGLAHALKERRREMDVQQQGRDSGTRTEELRIVLQQYRDLTERLLKV